MSKSLTRLYPGNRITFLVVLLALLLFVHADQNQIQQGFSYRGERHPVSEVHLLRDLTYTDEKGFRHIDQQIFDEILDIIDGARHLIVLDMFLFNAFQGLLPETTRGLSGELTQKLITQKQRYPDMEIIVISDPVNTVYGGLPSPHFEALSQAGVQVVVTDLNQLRDSNPLYSALWRLLIKPFGNSYAETLPNPFGPGKVSLRSWLKLANFKANHRKMILADYQEQWIALVTSANPHDGSSAHSNTAIRFSGPAVSDLMDSEAAVIRISGGVLPLNTPTYVNQPATEAMIQVLTESEIKSAVLESINRAESSDQANLLMFYLSDREVVDALKLASQRGVSVQVVLDPNKDAFGRKKNGIPNRQTGNELMRAGVDVRWCDTHGEQCHAKTLLVNYQQGQSRLISGSANFTRRNLQDFNLETDVQIIAPQSHEVIKQANALFEQIWNNKGGKSFSLEYNAYRDESTFRYWLYRFMEATGMSTF